MASIQEAVVAYIEANLPAVGKGYPNLVPADAVPAWSYRVVDDDEQLSHSGGTGLNFARLMIEPFPAKSLTTGAYNQANANAKAIKGLLHGFRGDLNGVTIHFCRVSQSDDYGELRELPAVRLEVFLTYRLL